MLPSGLAPPVLDGNPFATAPPPELPEQGAAGPQDGEGAQLVLSLSPYIHTLLTTDINMYCDIYIYVSYV